MSDSKHASLKEALFGMEYNADNVAEWWPSGLKLFMMCGLIRLLEIMNRALSLMWNPKAPTLYRSGIQNNTEIKWTTTRDIP